MSVLAQQQQQQQQYAAHPQQQNVVPQQPLFAAIKDNSGNQIMVSFQLEVAQQPDRARMCGFGDKVAALAYPLHQVVTADIGDEGSQTNHTTAVRATSHRRTAFRSGNQLRVSLPSILDLDPAVPLQKTGSYVTQGFRFAKLRPFRRHLEPRWLAATE